MVQSPNVYDILFNILRIYFPKLPFLRTFHCLALYRSNRKRSSFESFGLVNVESDFSRRRYGIRMSTFMYLVGTFVHHVGCEHLAALAHKVLRTLDQPRACPENKIENNY